MTDTYFQHRKPTRRVYTVPLFAGELGISERTVWRLIADQKISTIKISIGRTGIPASELDRIVAGGLNR
jgi:predicted DNA-binding transcriptional regulator AlpA